VREHSIFYYPYASFGYEQAPLLRAAALYFNKLYVLDPEKARARGTGALEGIGKDVLLLEREGLIERISPEQILERQEQAIEKAIRADIEDPEFVQLCESSGPSDRWTLALAKVPKGIREDTRYKPKDAAMQRLMGEIPRSLAGCFPAYSERYLEITKKYQEVGGYVETSLNAQGQVAEFRQADFPLPLGESIMINHALFGGLVEAGATPITDDQFHHSILSYKIKRARNHPQVHRLLEDLEISTKIKANFLTTRVFQEEKLQVELPSFSPNMPMEQLLKYRHKHSAELEGARREFSWLAQQVAQAPWTEEFEETIYREYLPNRIRPLLEECGNSSRSWLKTAGMAAGLAGATIALLIGGQPLLSLTTASAALAVVGHDVVPLASELKSLISDPRKAKGYGLQYFMKVK
jgi:hypothetical protein